MTGATRGVGIIADCLFDRTPVFLMKQPAHQEFSSVEMYLRLLSFVRPYGWAFLVALLSMAVTSAMEPALRRC